MPIVIDRKSGKVISAPRLTPEQNQRVWEIIVTTYIQKHPEVLSDENLIKKLSEEK